MDERRHLAVLDGLRGLAILLVMLPHLAIANAFPGPSWAADAAFRFAHGVEIFFVLSGFCLAYPIMVQLHTHGEASLSLTNFFFNRVWRIVPLYLLATAFTIVIAATLVHGNGRAIVAVPPNAWSAIAPLFLLDRGVDFANPTFWSVPVQVRWYLAFPLLMKLWLRAPRLFVTLTVLAWLAYLATRVRTIDGGVVPLFMLGIIAADLFVRRDRRTRWALLLLVPSLALGLAGDHVAWVPNPHGRDEYWTAQPTTIGWQLSAFFLILTATTTPWVGRLFTFAPLRILGIASFSLYLTHEAVIAAIVSDPVPAAGVVALAACLAVGLLAFALLERPLTDRMLRRRLRDLVVPRLEPLFTALAVPATTWFQLQRYGAPDPVDEGSALRRKLAPLPASSPERRAG
jgi:peptidoglycan/LPS O-acetylase OafA/YrhL